MKKISLFIKKNFLLLLALLIFASSFSPELQPVYHFLDSDQLAFNIGGTRISIYFLMKGLFLVVLLVWGARWVSDFGEKKIKDFLNLKVSDRALLIKGFQLFVYAAATLLGLELLGINITTLTVFGGAIGVGVGFGLQRITASFISGLILLFEKTISEGDLLELEGGMLVIVKRISARYTLVESFEKREIMIPNEELITHRISNWTFSNRLGRGEIQVGVAYESDLERVNQILLQAAREHPLVLKDPAPTCFLIDFSENAIQFRLYFWIENMVEGTLRVKSDLLFALDKKFSEHGIKIPFPQRDIRLISLPSLDNSFATEQKPKS